VTTVDGVVLFDANSGKQVLSLPISGATATAFSPRGTYLQTFQKPTGQQKNLTLWNTSNGEVAFQLFQKTASKANWLESLNPKRCCNFSALKTVRSHISLVHRQMVQTANLLITCSGQPSSLVKMRPLLAGW
jgi:hypothetical protein